METVSIPVSRAIFERLQKLAVPLVDDASAVIERLIDHWESSPPVSGTSSGSAPPAANGPEAHVWRSSRGEVFPVGVHLRAFYRDHELRATITPEGIEFAGKAYDNPSSAAIAAKNSVGVTGDAAATNGWKFWEMQGPGGQRWVPIDGLRSRFALTQEVLAALARIAPQEAKALRKRFAIDTDDE
jgi:hypothetical protein